MSEFTGVQEVEYLPSVVGKELGIGGGVRAGVGTLVGDVFSEGAGAGEWRGGAGARLAVEIFLVSG